MAGSKLKLDLNRDGSGLTDIETQLISFTIVDDLYMPRVLAATISNPNDGYNQNSTSSDPKYIPGDEIVIVDTDTSKTLFRGRIESILNPTTPQYGQVIELIARDNLQQLIKREFEKDYDSGSLAGRHLVIKDIIDDHRYSSATIVTGDALSVASANTTSLTYKSTEGHRRPLHVIQDLAREDPWESGATPSNFGAAFYLDEDLKFNYFKMASKPDLAGGTENGLTIQHGGTPGNLVKQMVTSSFDDDGFDLISECTVSFQDSTTSDQFKKIRLKAINMAAASRDVQYAVGATVTEETTGLTSKVQYSNIATGSPGDGVLIVSNNDEDDGPINTFTIGKDLTGAATDGGSAIVAEIKGTVENNLQMIVERHIVGDDLTTQAQAVDAAKPLLLRGSTGDMTGAKKQKTGSVVIVEYPMYYVGGAWKIVRVGEAIRIVNTATATDGGTIYAVTRIEHHQGPGTLSTHIEIADVGMGPGPKQPYSEQVFRKTAVATNIKTTNGTLTAGAGDVVINAKGITMKGGDDTTTGSKIRFEGAATGVAHGVLYANDAGSSLGDMNIIPYPIAGGTPSNLVVGKSGSTGAILPGNDATMDLGSNAKAWDHVYANDILLEDTATVSGAVQTGAYGIFRYEVDGAGASTDTLGFLSGQTSATPAAATGGSAFWTMGTETVGTGSRLHFEPIVDYATSAGADNYAWIGYHNPLVGIQSYWHNAGDGTAASPTFTFSGDIDNGMYLYAANQVGFAAGGAAVLAITSSVVFPSATTDTIELGSISRKWEKIWTVDIDSENALNVSSDSRLKENIQPAKLGLDFINDLNPVTYKMKKKKEGSIDPTHHGIVAQNVIETLKDYGITSLEDFGGITYNETNETESYYSAAYTEFIPILMKAIQELSAEVRELKEKI